MVSWCLHLEANAMNRLLILSGFVLYLSAGCSSMPSPHVAPPSNPAAQLSVLFVPVLNPVRELCTDDTLSRTEWFNQPVVKFSGRAIELNNTAATMETLRDWARKYYEHKVERVLYVQISPDSRSDAARVLLLLTQLLPDLHVRLVEFGFSCPNIQR